MERGWAGLECLSGILGLVGATPMQNVGAYGQEVSDTVTGVHRHGHRAHRDLRQSRVLRYRDSLFRSGEPGRWVVLSVSYRLRPNGSASVRYADVEKHLAARGITAPTLAEVRASVLAIRRSKSMVLDLGDDNRRSCGSFFTNPIIPAAALADVEARAAIRPRPLAPARRARQALGRLAHRAGRFLGA